MTSLKGIVSDFSTVASQYDATRHIPEDVLRKCYDILRDRHFLPETGLVLDAGCGTGQISIPLLSRGLSVVGIDLSEAMVCLAQKKTSDWKRARYEVGDVRSIAYEDGAFDAVVFSKLLMHIEDWQSVCREFVRVAKPGSAVIQILDRGAFGNAVRKEFSRRADAMGFIDRFPGPVGASGEISEYMTSLGCSACSLRPDGLDWDHVVTRRAVLNGFQERLFAEFWYIPVEIYDSILRQTYEWSIEQPGSLDEPEHLRPYLLVEIYRTSAPR